MLAHFHRLLFFGVSQCVVVLPHSQFCSFGTFGTRDYFPNDNYLSCHTLTSRESSVVDLTTFDGGMAGEVSCLEHHCFQHISWTLHGMTFTQVVDPWTRLLLLHTLCHVGHCVICSIRCAGFNFGFEIMWKVQDAKATATML